MAGLDEQSIEAIAQRTAAMIIAERKDSWIDPQKHYGDHSWISQRKKEEEEFKKFKLKVINSLAIWAALIVVGFIATSAWNSFVDAAKAAGSGGP